MTDIVQLTAEQLDAMPDGSAVFCYLYPDRYPMWVEKENGLWDGIVSSERLLNKADVFNDAPHEERDPDIETDVRQTHFEMLTDLAKIREDRGLTIKEVADRMQVPQTTVKKYFVADEASPTLDLVECYAAAVGATLNITVERVDHGTV